MPNYWFFLSDPEDYHLAELFRHKQTMWDGVYGAAAQKFLATIRKGDLIIGYHTAPEKSAYAVLQATRNAYTNPERNEKNWVVNVRAVEALKRPVPLAELKASPKLKRMRLFRMFRPIAVSPLTAAEFRQIRRLGGL